MKNLKEKVKVIKQSAHLSRGWMRTAIFGDEEERAKVLKKIALYLGLILLFGNLVRGILLSGGEPVGDLKLSEQKTAPEAPSPYRAFPYRETYATSKAQGKKARERQTKFSGLELFQRPAIPIPPGTFAKAILLTGASQGPVEAKLTEDTKQEGEIILRSGSILRGTASSSDDRVVIHFAKLRKDDGGEESIQAQAYDLEDKTAGLKTSRFWREVKKFGLSGALNFAGGLAEGLQDNTVKNNVAVRESSLKNGLLNGAKDAARGEAQEIISEMRSKPPAPEVSPSTPILVGFE
jgi:hypothetical protein